MVKRTDTENPWPSPKGERTHTRSPAQLAPVRGIPQGLLGLEVLPAGLTSKLLWAFPLRVLSLLIADRADHRGHGEDSGERTPNSHRSDDGNIETPWPSTKWPAHDAITHTHAEHRTQFCAGCRKRSIDGGWNSGTAEQRNSGTPRGVPHASARSSALPRPGYRAWCSRSSKQGVFPCLARPVNV